MLNKLMVNGKHVHFQHGVHRCEFFGCSHLVWCNTTSLSRCNGCPNEWRDINTCLQVARCAQGRSVFPSPKFENGTNVFWSRPWFGSNTTRFAQNPTPSPQMPPPQTWTKWGPKSTPPPHENATMFLLLDLFVVDVLQYSETCKVSKVQCLSAKKWIMPANGQAEEPDVQNAFFLCSSSVWIGDHRTGICCWIYGEIAASNFNVHIWFGGWTTFGHLLPWYIFSTNEQLGKWTTLSTLFKHCHFRKTRDWSSRGVILTYFRSRHKDSISVFVATFVFVFIFFLEIRVLSSFRLRIPDVFSFLEVV